MSEAPGRRVNDQEDESAGGIAPTLTGPRRGDLTDAQRALLELLLYDPEPTRRG
ncbi:hypothetical protein [Nocardiopsis gilva]|uniref:hypothetical protein n=1 Tax=Nocardiopsis gilva TaxID=280236 RepID=UPI0012FE22D9|nr:hypothetical protein [Nocardiopsis gilva]